MADATSPLRIDIVADVMCPWCYIGKKRLEKALEARPGIAVDIRWRPYQLDDTIPEDGMAREAYIAQKFGDRAGQIYNRVRAAGAGDGIDFAFEKMAKAPNTLNAHRLIHWATVAGVQGQVVERLFSAYFLNGEDITDKGLLADMAAEAGMERAVVERLLAGDTDKDVVREEIDVARRMGVQGVPCFIFAGKYVVNGAQGPEVLVQALDAAAGDGGTTG